jgi:hypothetical protein
LAHISLIKRLEREAKMKQAITVLMVLLMGCVLAATAAEAEAVKAPEGEALSPSSNSVSTPLGWTDYLLGTGSGLTARKITFAFEAFKETDPVRKPIRREVQFATIYSGPRPASTKLESSVFSANLLYMTALNVADYFTTRAALKYDGMVEANPIMRPFVKNDMVFAAVKMGFTVSNYFIMKRLFKKNKPLAWAVSIATNAVMSYVVVSNLQKIQGAQPRSICQ